MKNDKMYLSYWNEKNDVIFFYLTNMKEHCTEYSLVFMMEGWQGEDHTFAAYPRRQGDYRRSRYTTDISQEARELPLHTSVN